MRNELQEAKEKAKQESNEKNKLLMKLKVIKTSCPSLHFQIVQEKLLTGNLKDENERHEAEVRRREAELDRKIIEERNLKRELAEREEKKAEAEKKYASLQEEAEAKTKKLKKVSN